MSSDDMNAAAAPLLAGYADAELQRITARPLEGRTRVEGTGQPLPELAAPTDERIRAYLDANPAVFREFLDRARRTDPAWWDRISRRDARIHGRPYP